MEMVGVDTIDCLSMRVGCYLHWFTYIEWTMWTLTITMLRRRHHKPVPVFYYDNCI